MLVYISLSELDLLRVRYEIDFTKKYPSKEIEYLFCDFDDKLFKKPIDHRIVEYFLKYLNGHRIHYSFQTSNIEKYGDAMFLKGDFCVETSPFEIGKAIVDLNLLLDLKDVKHDLVYSYKIASKQTQLLLSKENPLLVILNHASRDNFYLLNHFPFIFSDELSNSAFERKTLKFFSGDQKQTNVVLLFLINLLTNNTYLRKADEFENNTLALKKSLNKEINRVKDEFIF